MQFVAITLKDIQFQQVQKPDDDSEFLFMLGNFEITDKLGSLVKFKQFLKRKEALPGGQERSTFERVGPDRRMQPW
jgi:hypothetical protein